MSYEMIHNAEHYVKKRRRKSRLLKTLAVMACVVVFCTTYALILPAITSKTDIFCGLEEHVHTKDCYVQVSVEEPTLVCSAQTLGVHTHGSDCVDSTGKLICGLADYVAHAHNELCYDAEGTLVCTLEERDTHYHSEECYALPQTSAPEHVHGESCYSRVQGELTCTLSEESHSHSETCYTQGETLVCTVIEEGHVHEAACYESVLSCELAETEGHQHGETCYAWSEELTCGMEEILPSETQGDAFTAPDAHQVVCGNVQAETHVHSEACFQATEQTLTCKDSNHSHTELCYGVWELTCQIEAHTHGEICYSNPEADVEEAAVWEKTFSEVELTGDWQQDVLSIAKTQLGYSESTKNYTVNEAGVRKGYSRYGAWYGDPYGDWCAMFTSFCMRYAGVDGIPLNAACTPWIRQLKEMNLFRELGTYTPHSGDLIFYDWECDGLSDHVGFVSEYLEPTDTEPAKIVALEGNSSNRVQYVEYEANDERIVGFGLLSRNRLHRIYCGIDEHTHDDACYDAEGALTCTIEEHIHSDACNEFRLVYHNDDLQVFVNIKGVSGLPADLSLSVTPVTREDAATFDAMEVALSREMASNTEYVGAAVFYSLQLHSEGQPYELPEEATVSVDMSFAEPIFTPEEMEDSSGMRTYVLSPDAEPPLPQADGEDPSESESEEKPNSKRGPTVTGTDSQETTSESEEAPEEETPTEYYDATPAEGEVLMEAENGITGVKFRSGEIATVAFALTRQTVTGTFWERVYGTEQLVSGGTYMIVSAEGNYALRGDNTNNYTAVTVETVKGNEQYYTISNSEDTNLRWTLTGSGSSYTIRNQGTSNYLYMDDVGSWFNKKTYLIYSSSKTLTLSYQATEKVWRIGNGTSYYLRNQGNGSFTRVGSTTSDQTQYARTYYSRDMMIFKLSDVSSLDVPPDVEEYMDGSSADGVAPEKPNYPDFVAPSGEKTGETALSGDVDGTTVSIKGEYFSDPATSDIEREYQADSFAEHELNDGKVLTDKSVIYMDDDYGAFEEYDANTFGVTLSALGQQYKVPYQEDVKIPIDVVFVLDVSGSMATKDSDGSDASRIENMARALNSAIYKIMENNPDNRVGVAVYSGGAWELLPLGRYKADNNVYFEIPGWNTTDTDDDVISYEHTPTGRTISPRILYGADSLTSEDGKTSYKGVGLPGDEKNVCQGIGTYTQAGIAVGRNIFKNIGDDTTVTRIVGEGEYQRPITYTRQPVMLILSDGEPTYSTNIYMDPLNGPHYGDGSGRNNDGSIGDNAQGIHGYYTVLTANYCKRMVSIQYQTPALFYTVGMGILSEEQGDGPKVTTSFTGDDYKRAVLNPTKEIIENLTYNGNVAIVESAITSDQMRELMLGQYDERVIRVAQNNWSEVQLGAPHVALPVISTNPYADNYSYADKAYFGTIDLTHVFTSIIELSSRISPYGFILYNRSEIDIVDNIGYGMEMKGDPILRYNGVNYTMTSKSTNGSITTYVYDYIHEDPYIPNCKADLTSITVAVETKSDGTQTVKLIVPDDVLPTYTPELIAKEYYYEMLPVRLIYRVGLTKESEEKVLDLQKTGGEITFYTNKWQSLEDVAISELVPSPSNTFYNDVPDDGLTPQYQEHHDIKDKNTTQTRENAVDCTTYIDTSEDNKTGIRHYLGNNGKLVFTAETTEIPVEKSWQEVNPDIMNPVTVELYLVNVTVNDNGIVKRTGTLVNSVVLNTESEWKGVFTDVTLPGEDSYYVVVEKSVPGYQAFYNGETVRFSLDNDVPILGMKVNLDDPETVLVKIINAPALELPETGGPGVTLYTLGGCLLIAAAGIALMYTRNGKRRKGDKAHS